MASDQKPKLAIVTESLRRDNHAPLRFFQRVSVTHFYGRAPYQDMNKEEFAGATQYRGLFDLYKKLLAQKPDIIQGSEPYASRKSLLLSIVTLLAARRLKVPYVFPTLENVTPTNRFGSLIGPIIQWYFSLYAHRAKAIIALNNGAAGNLRAVGIPDKKIVRFPWGVWGVDRTVFYPRKQLPNPIFKDPTVLYVGRLDPEKGIRDLLHAFAQLAPQYPSWQLVLIGRGMMEDDISTFAKANRLHDRIHRLNWVTSRELPGFYSASTLTVYPSVTAKRDSDTNIKGWSEQVGTVILQSLACGTPVVATKSGAIPEYLTEEVGTLVPERDPDSLGRAIARMMSDEKFRQRLARAGEQYIANRFDANKNVERAEELVASWVEL